MSFVEFKNVTKFYQMGEQKIAAADGVDFVIEKGEFAVIVGPSGAGKTTVLNMLGGMDACSGGEIWLDGNLVSSYNRKQLTEYRRYDVGFVFQFYNLVQNLTALENVELASEICRDPLDAKAVSYTHLDVYKRQPLSALLLGIGTSADSPRSCRNQVDDAGENGVREEEKHAGVQNKGGKLRRIVKKRAGRREAEEAAARADKKNHKGESAEHPQHDGAVSYTHLDVYKRQVLYSCS